MSEALPTLLTDIDRRGADALQAELVASGVPVDVTRDVATFEELFGGLDCVELSRDSGEPIESIAAVRLQIEDRLGLGWLLEHVVGLPRDNRWRSLARLTLREDLLTQLRRITGIVLAGTDSSSEPAERFATWSSTNNPKVARLAQVLSDIRSAGSGDLATLSVGLREVAQLS